MGMAISIELCHLLEGEAVSVFDGCYSGATDKCPAHGPGGSESRTAGNEGDAQRAALQQLLSALNARPLDVGPRRHADSGLEGPSEVARAHVGPACQGLHAEVLVEVVRDPRLQLSQRLPLGRVRGELGTELSLPPGAADEQHELPGHLESRLL